MIFNGKYHSSNEPHFDRPYMIDNDWIIALPRPATHTSFGPRAQPHLALRAALPGSLSSISFKRPSSPTLRGNAGSRSIEKWLTQSLSSR